jgi:hypothetical protein
MDSDLINPVYAMKPQTKTQKPGSRRHQGWGHRRSVPIQLTQKTLPSMSLHGTLHVCPSKWDCINIVFHWVPNYSRILRYGSWEFCLGLSLTTAKYLIVEVYFVHGSGVWEVQEHDSDICSESGESLLAGSHGRHVARPDRARVC